MIGVDHRILAGGEIRHSHLAIRRGHDEVALEHHARRFHSGNSPAPGELSGEFSDRTHRAIHYTFLKRISFGRKCLLLRRPALRRDLAGGTCIRVLHRRPRHRRLAGLDPEQGEDRRIQLSNHSAHSPNRVPAGADWTNRIAGE